MERQWQRVLCTHQVAEAAASVEAGVWAADTDQAAEQEEADAESAAAPEVIDSAAAAAAATTAVGSSATESMGRTGASGSSMSYSLHSSDMAAGGAAGLQEFSDDAPQPAAAL